MELIKHYPQTLLGPRTYFSLIDRNNLEFTQNWQDYKNELDQILKVLLLTKDVIVVAGSSLCTEKAYEYFSEKDKELLFKKGILRPAIRSQFSNFSEVFDDRVNNKKEILPAHINNFFSSVITEIVPWELKDNAGWFEAQVTKQVFDPISVLRGCLRNIGQNYEESFVKLLSHELELSQSSGYYFDRDRITSIIKNNFYGTKVFIPIFQFIDLLYYISGSRVVNCENYVPQENLIYYNHATMNFGQKIISDKAVFYNIVTNIMLGEIYNNTFPIDIIKNISITDIIELRESNKSASQSFREKYEECLKVADSIHTIDDKDNLLLNLHELNTISEEIRNQFTKTIIGELGIFKSKLKISKRSDYVFEIASQLIGLFILPVSIISLIFNDTQLKKTGLMKKIRVNNTIVKEKLIRGYLKKVYKNDPVILSFFNDIVKKHKENYLRINL